jgi:predicted flap endonuclease-1-like 5' DNA nuclease
MAIEDRGQTLAAFTVNDGKAARRLLENLQKVDEVDGNVELLDAAVVDRSKRGRIVVHQTHDKGGLKGGAKGAGIGVIVGAIVLGPAGAVVGGAAGGVLNGIRNRIHDSGIDDKFMREVSKEIENGKSALFVQYVGDWSGSLGMVERAITEEQALLFNSTLPPEKAAALQALIVPATEELGGEEAVADYELEVEEEATAEETAAAEAEAPAEEAPAEEAPAPAAAGPADDLTQLVGIGPKAAAALTAAGITTYAALAASNEPQLRQALLASGMMPPGSLNTWPGQADYAARGDWQGLMKRNAKARSAAAPAAGTAAAAAAAPAAAPAQRDDLTQISGIGARLASILERGGVTSYQQLEQMSPDELREIIALGGALPPSSLSSWPAQASYASRGDWSGLASYNRSR